MESIKIFFNKAQKFDLQNIKPLIGTIGLYFILLEKIKIQYPFKKSKLIYIGMSEKKTTSIGSRLSGHYEGKTGNIGLINYRKIDQIYFTYINFEMLNRFWRNSIENLETYFILDFVKNYGVYPICNNRTGTEVIRKNKKINFDIDWDYFEK